MTKMHILSCPDPNNHMETHVFGMHFSQMKSGISNVSKYDYFIVYFDV